LNCLTNWTVLLSSSGKVIHEVLVQYPVFMYLTWITLESQAPVIAGKTLLVGVSSGIHYFLQLFKPLLLSIIISFPFFRLPSKTLHHLNILISIIPCFSTWDYLMPAFFILQERFISCLQASSVTYSTICQALAILLAGLELKISLESSRS
jgi:hypothetical protein